MPTYNIKCYECSRKHPTEVPYVNLDAEQLDCLNEGGELNVYDHNLPVGVTFDPSQAKEVAENGYITDNEDFRQVCGDCGSDYWRDEQGNIIND